MNAVLEQINSTGKAFVEFSVPMLVQSSALIVILLLVDFVLRKKVKAVFRYCIWMLVLVKLVLPTSLSSPLSLGYWFGDKLAYVAESRTAAAPEAEVVEPALTYMLHIIEPAPIEVERLAPAVLPMVPDVEPAVTEAVSPPAVSVTPVTWQGVVFLLWLAVVIALGLLLLQRAMFVRGLVAQAKEANALMNGALEYCCKCMGVKRKVGLKVSANAASPAVCGLFRPVILLPHKLAPSLGSRGLRAVLLHELAHIRRGDLWVNLAQTVLQIMYFYNPLLWVANCVIRRVREQAIDETVLVTMGEKAQQYPQTLVNVAKLAFKRPVLSLRLIGVVESKSALAGRIKHILNRPMPKSAKIGIVGVLAVIIAGAVLLPMAAARQRDGWADKDLLIKFTEQERGEPRVIRSAGKAAWQKSYDVEFAPWEELLVVAELYQAGKPMRQLGQKVFSGSSDAQTFSVNFVRTYKNDAKTIVGHSGTVELGDEVLEIAEFTVNTQRYFSGEGWGGYHGDGLRRTKARYTKKEYAELKTLFYYHSTDGGGVDEGEANFWIPGHNVTPTGSHHCVVLKMIPLSRLEYLVCEPVGGWQGLDGQAIAGDLTADRAEAIADKYKQMIVDSVEQQWAVEKQAEMRAGSLEHFIGKYAMAGHPDTAAFEITKKGDVFIFSSLGGPKFEMEEAEDGLKFADGGGERFRVWYDASKNVYYLDNLGIPGKEWEPESILLTKISAKQPGVKTAVQVEEKDRPAESVQRGDMAFHEALEEMDRLRNGKDTPWDKVDQMVKELTAKYRHPVDQGLIYYYAVGVHGMSGLRQPEKCIEYAKKGEPLLKHDPARLMQLYIFWGDAIQIKHKGGRWQGLAAARRELAPIYLRGVKVALDQKLPDKLTPLPDPPEMGAPFIPAPPPAHISEELPEHVRKNLEAYKKDYPAMRKQFELIAAEQRAKRKAWDSAKALREFQKKTMRLRELARDKAIQYYARMPFDTAEFKEMATKILQDQKELDLLLGRLKRLINKRMGQPKTKKPAVSVEGKEAWGKAVEGVQSRLRRGVFRNGVQWLNFDLRNDSSGLSIHLAPGGVPTDILVDTIPYSWGGRVAGKMPICKPGQAVSGAQFKLDKNWSTAMELDKNGKLRILGGQALLELKPGKHTVQAVVYAVDLDAADSDRREQILSNPIEITIERALPGSRLSIDETVKEDAPFAAVCEAVAKPTITTALSPRRDPFSTLSQEFKVVEVLFGKAEAVDRIDLVYKVYGKERDIRNHERVIWIGHTRHMSFHGSLYGLKALPDTPENRQVVKAAASQSSTVWGEAVDGVQVGVTVEKTKWRIGGDVPRVNVEVRISDPKKFEESGLASKEMAHDWSAFAVEIDGKQYKQNVFYTTVRVPLRSPFKIVLFLDDEWQGGLYGEPWLNPGRHTIRVLFVGLGMRLPSGPVEIEVLPDDKKLEPWPYPWGKAVGGVQVSAHPAKPVWQVGSEPVIRVCLRNQGNTKWWIHEAPSSFALEVDGKRYENNFIFHVWRRSFAPGDVLQFDLKLSKSRPFHDGLRKGNSWPPVGKPPPLLPGKHTVRVLFTEWNMPSELASNPVEFEIVPAGSDVPVEVGSNAPIGEASKENKKPQDPNEPSYDGRSLSELVAALGDQDFQTRINAVYHLGYMGPKAKPAVPALVDTLGEERLRESVLHSLGNIGVGADEAIPALIKAIAEYAPACRWMAAESLAKIGNAAVPPLKKAAGSEDIYLRIWCNAALAKQEGTDSASLRYLAQLMKNADKRTAGEAVSALTMLGPISKPLVPDLIKALKHSVVPKKHIASALAQIGKNAGQAVPELTKMLQDTDLGTRADAIYALSRIGGTDVAPAVPLLIQALKTNDTSNTAMASRVRYTAATALGGVGPDARPAIPALVIALDDKNEFVRANSAKAIGDIDPTDLQAVPALLEAMKDESGRVRVAAAQTLLKIGPVNKEVILAFIEAANDNWKGVITACETFFSFLGPQHSYVIPDLIGILKTPNERAQRLSINALGNMGESAAPAVPYIIEGMKNSRLEAYASGALRKLGPKAKAAVPELIKMLGDKRKRFSAALVLEAIGPQAREAIPALENCLSQSRFVLYARALLAINPKSDKAIQQLVRVAESAYVTDQWTEQPDAHYLLVKYGHEGNRYIQALIDALENPNSRIRLSAAAYLGKLGAKANEAAESLGKALKDDDPEVRAEAAHAILLISLKPSERKEAIDVLMAVLDGKDFAGYDGLFMAQVRAAGALASFGPLEEWTVPLLIVKVQDGSMHTRVAAIKAFGNIGPGAKEALPFLKRLLKDEDWQIRQSATEAIAQIKAGDGQKTDVEVEREGGWGEVVEGVQVRLLAYKVRWKVDEVPTLKADVRNGGERRIHLPESPDYCLVQVDGRWFFITGYEPGKEVGLSTRVLDFLPGQQRKGIPLELSDKWETMLDSEVALGAYVRHAGIVTGPGLRSRLKLTPGKHTIRVSFIVTATGMRVGINPLALLQVVSNPVEIEIVAAKDVEADIVAEEAERAAVMSAAENAESLKGTTFVAAVDMRNIDRWRSLGIRRGFGNGEPICDFVATAKYVSRYGNTIRKGDRFTIGSAKVSGSRDGYGNVGTKLILRSAAPKEGLAFYCYGFDRADRSFWAIGLEEIRQAVKGYFVIEGKDRTAESVGSVQVHSRESRKEALEKAGARLTLDKQGNITEIYFGGKATDRNLGLLKGLTGLKRLNLKTAKITDNALVNLRGLTQLEYLSLYETRITDAALVHLQSLRGLRELGLAGNKITDAGLESLKPLVSLERLDIRHTIWVNSRMQISDAGLAHLKGLTGLRSVDLMGTEVTAQGLKHLRALPKLESLTLSGQKITDAAMAPLAEMKSLRRLELRFTAVTDSGAEQLRNMPQLKQLSLSSRHLTDAGMVHIEALRQLKHLELRGPHFGDASLAHVAKLPQIERIDLTDWSGDRAVAASDSRDTRYTATGLALLGQIETLCVLWLNHIRLGDTELQQLSTMKHLKGLTLMTPRLDIADDADLRRKALDVQRTLRKALPDTRVHVGGWGFDLVELDDPAVVVSEFDEFSVKFRGIWMHWQDVEFTVRGDGSVRFSMNKGPKDKTRYKTAFKLSGEHLAELSGLLRRTNWLTAPGANVQPRFSDATRIDISLTREDKVHSVWCHDRNAEPYLSLIIFLKRIHRQEYLLYQMTVPGVPGRNSAFGDVYQQIRAEKGEPVSAHPHRILDFGRFVAPSVEVIGHPDENHYETVAIAVKILGKLKAEQVRPQITDLTTAERKKHYDIAAVVRTEDIRAAAVEALTELGGEQARRHVRDMAKNHRSWRRVVNEAIVESLLELDKDNCAELLKDMAAKTKKASWGLIRLRPAALPAIVEILEVRDTRYMGQIYLIRQYIDHWEEVTKPIDARVIEAVQRNLDYRLGRGPSWTQYHKEFLQLAGAPELPSKDARQIAEEFLAAVKADDQMKIGAIARSGGGSWPQRLARLKELPGLQQFEITEVYADTNDNIAWAIAAATGPDNENSTRARIILNFLSGSVWRVFNIAIERPEIAERMRKRYLESHPNAKPVPAKESSRPAVKTDVLIGSEMVGAEADIEDRIRAVIDKFWAAVEADDFGRVRQLSQIDMLEKRSALEQTLKEVNEERKQLLSRGIDISTIMNVYIRGDEAVAVGKVNKGRIMWYYLEKGPDGWLIKLFDDAPKERTIEEIFTQSRDHTGKTDLQVETETPSEKTSLVWGQAVEGVQIWVRPERQRWYEGETPKFRVDMRNNGTVEWELGLTHEHWEVELDGLWHRVGASFSGYFRTLLFGPGQEHKDIEFYPGVWSEWNINGRPLKFTPGLHTVRLSFGPSTRDRANWRRLRVVSNAVVIEVLPAEADKRGWGEAVAGLQCGLRADKRLWKADETPRLQAVARNVGRGPWRLPRPSELFYLKVAGKIWRWKGPVFDRPADLEPREALDETTILLSKDWVGAYGSDLRLKLSPGKHAVQLVMFVSDPVPPEAPPGTIPIPKHLRIESNVVVVEVLPAGERPGTVDDEGDAATTLQAELYEVWQQRQDLAGAEAFGKKLLEKYTEREEQALIYYQLAEIYAQSGQINPSKTIEYARAGWWHLHDPVKKARLFVYWGDALQLSKGRREAAKIYLRGLEFCLQFGLPEDKPELPAVSRYRVDGPPEVVEEYRRRNQLEMAVRKQAKRIRELIEHRQALTGQIVQLYAREPDGFDELHELVMKYLHSEEAAEQLIAAAKAYRSNPNVAIPVIMRMGPDPKPDGDLSWGEAVEGIRVRLRAEKAQWVAGEVPKFKMDVRNDGSHILLLTSVPDYWGVEVDGVWYSAAIPMLGGAKGMSFGPDKQWYDLTLSLDMALGSPSENGRVELAPGRHTVRAALSRGLSQDGRTISLRAVSNPVEIEILPAKTAVQVEVEGAAAVSAESEKSRQADKSKPGIGR